MPNSGQNKKKNRKQFEFSDTVQQRLNRIVNYFDTPTESEALRRSLSLTVELIEIMERGDKLGYKDKDGKFVGLLIPV